MRWGSSWYSEKPHVYNAFDNIWFAWRPVVASKHTEKMWVWWEYVRVHRRPYAWHNAFYGTSGTAIEYLYEVLEPQPDFRDFECW